jgi:site-specific recombinase XerD
MALSVYIFAKMDYVSKKSGTVPIYLGILVNGAPKSPIPLNCKVKPEWWDNSEEIPRAKKSAPEHKDINGKIINALSKGRKIIQKYEVLEKVLTYERFMKEWGGFNPYDLDQHVKEYVKRLRSAKNQKTGKPIYAEEYCTRIESVMGKVSTWRPNLDLQDIDFKLLEEYQLHLASIGNVENTIHGNMKIFRRVIRDGYHQDLISKNPFEKIRLISPKVDRKPLEIAELKKYEKLLLEDLSDYLRKTLCWFLLAVYTGRRYGDLENFYKWEIRKDYIRLIQDKQVAGVQGEKVIIIFMNDRIRMITNIIKENHYQVLSNQKANAFLKKLTELTGIDKKVTFHIARHTFNHINKKLRTNAVTRQELLGHESLRSTQVYEKPDPEQMQEAMLKWNQA